MMDTDLEDTHLCIKCSNTIVGLENYIRHRKRGCTSGEQPNDGNKTTGTSVDTRTVTDSTREHLNHTYDGFSYHEPEGLTTYVNKSQHGGKSTKSFTDTYELPYELGADVFFSSLQLQSVQATTPSTSGKTSSSVPHTNIMQRQKSEQESSKVSWMTHHGSTRNSERLINAFTEIGDVKTSYEHIFKSMDFAHESPDLSEDDVEEDDEELPNEVDDDDEDEDFEAIAAAAGSSGGKWKSSPLMRSNSPPVVPATHTGGKWRPENRPHMRVTHTQISRLSPTWDEQVEEVETPDTPDANQHPPADHTKGKWVPGTKLQRLEYKEVLTEAKTAKEVYWCNICCRRLKNKLNYGNHLKTGYHRKRAEPEQLLEKAALQHLRPADIREIFESEIPAKVEVSTPRSTSSKKRLRRHTYIRCDLCKHVMLRHLIGKHLISHYHYRRMHMNVGKSLRMILDNIHSIVLQSPFQCRPCRFYANTEEAFLLHWNSAAHLDASEGAGKFFCSFCQYECEDNNQMRRHLLGSEHKEVILAINRSVPISISKKLSINCSKCRQSFRYNAELRRHMKCAHPGEEVGGTASDIYQSRYKCEVCGECCRSQVALQRHEKSKHSIFKFFCSICNLQFCTPCQARRHRKTQEHRQQAALVTHQNSKRRHQAKPGSSLTCQKCHFIAKSEVEAVIHEISHSKTEVPKKVERRKRPKETSHAKEKFKKRARKNKTLISVKCGDCFGVFNSRTDLKDHRDTQHASLRHLCPCCGDSFITGQALGRHTRLCRPSSDPNLESKLSEIKNTNRSEDWTCDRCEFRSTYEAELIFHGLHHTHGIISKSELIKCPLCPKKFRKHSLRCHLRQHTNERIFECEFCKLKFSRRHNLKDHINKRHKPADSEDKHKTLSPGKSAEDNDEPSSIDNTKEQLHLCHTCNRQFATKYTLKHHKFMKHGIGQADFRCSYKGCQYGAISQAALKTHMASHGQENLQCDYADCGYTGKSLMHLLRHRRSHIAPTKLFSCDQCDFTARTQAHVRRHERSHLNERAHECPYCDFKCNSADNLRKHILKTNKHPRKFIYECQKCQELADEQSKIGICKGNYEFPTFKTNYLKEFQQHLASVHGN